MMIRCIINVKTTFIKCGKKKIILIQYHEQLFYNPFITVKSLINVSCCFDYCLTTFGIKDRSIVSIKNDETRDTLDIVLCAYSAGVNMKL